MFFVLTTNSDQTVVSGDIGKVSYHLQVALQETLGCKYQTSDVSRTLVLRVGFR